MGTVLPESPKKSYWSRRWRTPPISPDLWRYHSDSPPKSLPNVACNFQESSRRLPAALSSVSRRRRRPKKPIRIHTSRATWISQWCSMLICYVNERTSVIPARSVSVAASVLIAAVIRAWSMSCVFISLACLCLKSRHNSVMSMCYMSQAYTMTSKSEMQCLI